MSSIASPDEIVKSLGTGGAWLPLTTFTISANGSTRAVTDTSATGPHKFYRGEISKP